jgi:hypothetical protein
VYIELFCVCAAGPALANVGDGVPRLGRGGVPPARAPGTGRGGDATAADPAARATATSPAPDTSRREHTHTHTSSHYSDMYTIIKALLIINVH